MEDDSSFSSTASFLFCDVCNIQATSESQLRSHLLGQRHWQNVRQKDVAKRSVYVRGFPTDVGLKELTELFNQFGNVHNIMLNEEKIFAIIEFTTSEGALQTLRYPHKLTLGGSKLVIKPREFKTKEIKRKVRSSSVAMETEGGEVQGAESDSSIFSKVKLKLKHEEMVHIASLPTINDQILTLLSYLHTSPPSLINAHLLLSYLQSSLRGTFPNCRVLPFGSVVTGLATPTSDLDAVILTRWSQQDETDLGHTYFTPLHTTEEPSSTDDVSMDTNTVMPIAHTLNASLTTPPTTLSFASNVRVEGSRRFKNGNDVDIYEYITVVNEVSRLKKCCNVTAIPNARCPIVRFTYSDLKVNCDLSVNNRLGAYNSKLLQAYFNFDPRVVPLLRVLKSWIRCNHITGLNKRQLNNYALSLMLIYALQKTTPPVLPCLQSPGVWPRNMEWYGQQGFAFGGKVENLLINGWNTKYEHPSSFLPSQNKASLGELLYHFFHFYAHVFSFQTHAVTIHKNGPPLTISEASDLASSMAPPHLHSGQLSLKLGSMCVQDPFDLTHNVTKSVSHASLNVLIKEMSNACTVISSLLNNSSMNELGILSLFCASTLNEESMSSKEDESSPVKFRDTYNLCFNNSLNIQNLLLKVPSLCLLHDIIPSLDLTSSDVQKRLQAIILHCLVILLEDSLQFECTAINNETEIKPLLNLPTTKLETSHGIFNESFPSVAMATGNTPSSITNLIENTTPILKRPIGNKDSPIDDSHKKLKMTDSYIKDSILDQHCYTNEGVWFPSNIKCVARSNTWRGMRYKRRHQLDSTSLIESSPLLEFTMSLVNESPSSFSPHSDIINIQIKTTEESMNEELSYFFAYFRKLTL